MIADYFAEVGADLGTAPAVAADAAVRDLGELLHGWLVQHRIDERDAAAVDILDHVNALVEVPTSDEMHRRWSAMGRRPAL